MSKTIIGGQCFSRKLVSKLLSKDGQEELVGCVDPHTTEIFLLKEQSAESLLKSEWHEVLHIVLNNIGLKATETQVDSLADFNIQLFRDNPHLRPKKGSSNSEKITQKKTSKARHNKTRRNKSSKTLQSKRGD